MIITLQSRRWNRAGDLEAVLSVYDGKKDDEDDILIFEDKVNLSKKRSRNAFIDEVADRLSISRAKVETEVLGLLQDERGDRDLELQESGDGAGGKERKADRLVRESRKSGIELFHDQFSEPYAAMRVQGRLELLRLASRPFRERLSYLSYESWGESPSRDTLSAAITTMAGYARFEGSQYDLSVRTAWHDGSLYYDMGDGRAVRVDGKAWEMVDEPPILFRRFPAQKPQVEPEPGGDLKDLLSLVHLKKEEQKLLYVTDCVASLIPDISRPCSIFWGPQGSAKTFAMRFKKALMDPSHASTTGEPKNADSFVRQASHNLFLAYDNLSSMPSWFANGLSRFSTGEGHVNRALYTDDDDFVLLAQGASAITCIRMVVTQPDLLDRGIIYPMIRPSAKERIPEKQLLTDFDRMRPKLLWAMFDALSEAMRIRDGIVRDELPRLAEYSIWGCAVACALGYAEEHYWSAINANIKGQSREAIEGNVVAQALVGLMNGADRWEGSPSELLTALEGEAKNLKINIEAKGWPKNPSWAVRRLNEVVPNLAQTGIEFLDDREASSRFVSVKRVNSPS